MNKQLSLRKSAVFLLIILVSYLIISPVKWFVADIYYRTPFNVVKNWQIASQDSQEVDWGNSNRRFLKALEFDANNPESLMMAGLSYEGQYAFKETGFAKAEKGRKLALNFYRNSVHLRPAWPYGWIDLALVKYRLGELDEEFYKSILHASELGSWEPGVQKVIIEIGLHGWSKFDSKTQELVLKTIRKAVIHADKKHVKAMIMLLKKYGIFYYACLSNKDNLYLAKRCKRFM
ncbi:MAG: hypothetical protein GKR93_08600 [Gammaproteobacteria bacterium]|nr:hypothetical protein [Gammaproteobacteria bacterium]